MKDYLIQTILPSQKAEICHSFCYMVFDFSFRQRNHVISVCLFVFNCSDDLGHDLESPNLCPVAYCSGTQKTIYSETSYFLSSENSGLHKIKGMSEQSYTSPLFPIPYPGYPLIFSEQRSIQDRGTLASKISYKEFRKRDYSEGERF